MVAFMVLKVPRVSMSMTVLKALAESPEIGAMKLPAAPALKKGGGGLVRGDGGRREKKKGREGGGESKVHYKVDSAELFDAAVGGGFEGVEL